MNYKDLVRPEVLTQPVYEPGKPIELVAREFGLDPGGILKLASNENPLGPSPKGRDAAMRAVAEAHLYPDGSGWALRQKLAARHNISADSLIFGNGSNELMVLLAQAFTGKGDEAVMGAQAFIAFKLSVLLAGATPVEVPMPDLRHDLNAMRQAVTDRTRLVYLPNPNNPTGDQASAADIEAFARDLPEHVILLFDEAYSEYLDNPPDLSPLQKEGRKIICCRTFSKIFGLAGMRIGYAYADPTLISHLQQVRQPFNVNAIAQAAALAALDDSEFVRQSLATNRSGMQQLAGELTRLGLEYRETRANFLLLRAKQASEVFRALQCRGIIVRPLTPYGMPDWLRITIGTKIQNEALIDALETLLADSASADWLGHN